MAKNKAKSEEEQIFDNPDQEIEGKVKEPTGPDYGFSLVDARDFILACQKQAENEYQDVRAIWDDCWNAYTSTQDYSKKKDWQSKIYLPELYPAVKKATSMLKRILLRARRIFDLKDPLNDGMDSLEITGQEAVLDHWLNYIKWLKLLGTAIESGLVFGVGIVKLWWEPKSKTAVELSKQTKVEEDPATGAMTTFIDLSLDKVTYESSGLAGAVVDPRQVWFDKAGTFIIEESYIPLYLLEEQSKEGPNGEKPIYDKDQVKKLRLTDYGHDALEVERLKSLSIISSQNEFKPMAHVYEFHGDFFNRKGELVQKNAHLVLANKEYLLNPQMIKQPFNFYGALEGMPPYIKFSPIEMLFRNEGQSMIQAALTLQKALNNLINMSMDGLLWKLNKLLEVDPDLLRNPDVLKNLAPGRPILKRGEGQAVREVQFSDIPQGALASLEILRRAIQNVDFVSDIMLALNTKADTTATEVQVKTGEANAMWEGIGVTVEQELIVPFVEMTRQLAVINWDDFRDPVLNEIAQKYGLPLNATTREERIVFLLKNIKIRSGAVSEYFRKMEELKTLLDFLGVCAKIPPLYKRLNLREVADRIIGYFSFPDPKRLIISDEEEKKIAEQEQMIEMARARNLESQAQLNQASVKEMGMGGGNGGGGGPAALPDHPNSQPQQGGQPDMQGMEQMVQALAAMGGQQ